jgi:energy-coupling factor transport system permease protein
MSRGAWRDQAAAPLLVGALVGALVAARFEMALACLLVAAPVAWWVRAPRPSGVWVRVVAIGAALAWVLNLLLVPGDPIRWAGLGRLHATVEGARLGALFALRLVAASIAAHGLRAAWPGERLADAAARLLAPLERVRWPGSRAPSRPWVGEARATLGLALRFAPLVAVEAERIGRIQDARAGRPPRGPAEWLQRRRAATVPLVVRSLERAEQVALALEARHYRARPLAAASAAMGAARATGIAAGTTLAVASLLWRT